MLFVVKPKLSIASSVSPSAGWRGAGSSKRVSWRSSLRTWKSMAAAYSEVETGAFCAGFPSSGLCGLPGLYAGKAFKTRNPAING
jgi:hypothetical protein